MYIFESYERLAYTLLLWEHKFLLKYFSSKLHLKRVIHEAKILKAKLDSDSREDKVGTLLTKLTFNWNKFKILTKHHLFLFSDNKQKHIKGNYVKASCKLFCEERWNLHLSCAKDLPSNRSLKSSFPSLLAYENMEVEICKATEEVNKMSKGVTE